MTFPVPLHYEAIKRLLLCVFDSISLMKRLEEEGLVGRLVKGLKEGGLSHPHLDSISQILGLMLSTPGFKFTDEGLLPSCIAMLKEEVARSATAFIYHFMILFI